MYADFCVTSSHKYIMPSRNLRNDNVRRFGWQSTRPQVNSLKFRLGLGFRVRARVRLALGQVGRGRFGLQTS